MLEEKLEAVESQNVGQIRNLTDQLSNQTAQIDLLENQLKELHAEKSSLLKEVDESKTEKSSLQQKVRDASGSTAIQQQLVSLHDTNEKMRLAFLDKVIFEGSVLRFLGEGRGRLAEKNRAIGGGESNPVRRGREVELRDSPPEREIGASADFLGCRTTADGIGAGEAGETKVRRCIRSKPEFLGKRSMI